MDDNRNHRLKCVACEMRPKQESLVVSPLRRAHEQHSRYHPSAATASVSHFSTITTPVADNNDDQLRFPSQPFSWSILQQLMRESTSDTSKTTRPLEHKGRIIPFEPSERLAMLHPISKVFPVVVEWTAAAN